MELLYTNRHLCICIYVVAQMNNLPNMPQQSLQEILHDDNVRKCFGLPDDYDESQAEDLMNLSDEAIESTNAMLAFREYLIANAPSPSPEVAPHLKVAPVTPPSDDDDDSWGQWKGREEPPVTKRKQSSPVPRQDYPNGRPPGMPAMMPEPDTKGKGKKTRENPSERTRKTKQRTGGTEAEKRREMEKDRWVRQQRRGCYWRQKSALCSRSLKPAQSWN